MLLKDKLRPASFRGVPFQVEESGLGTGRRTQVHEYPQRDKPYAQDNGRATRRIEFAAFVVGADYVEKANALLGALEESGSGMLVHPWLGSMRVSVTEDCHVSFNSGLGVAEFRLSFVESGELTFPSSADSTAALSRIAAGNLESASVFSFADVFSVLGQISYVSTQALSVYSRVLNFLANPVFALASALGFSTLPGNLNSLLSLFGSPLDLGWNFAGFLNVSPLAKSGTLTAASTSAAQDAILSPMVRGLTRMANDPILAQPAMTTSTAAVAVRLRQNEKAILAHARQLLLVQAVGLSSYLKCAVYDDVVAVRSELAAALDAEATLATDDDLYQAITAARTAIWRDLTERSRGSARLVTITPPAVLPMLVIAYDYYEEAGRDAEIVARNGIGYPGFVPANPLRVLSQ